MPTSIKVSASILCADFTRLGQEVRRCEEAGVDMLHVDVMDGHFVPNITIGPMIVEALRSFTKLPLEAHLMIENPGRYIEAFVQAGADVIALPAECYGLRKEGCRGAEQFPKELESLDPQAARVDIRKIKQAGKKAFLVVNPGTPLCLDPVLSELDGVLIMSVNPGFSKQKFIPAALDKISTLRRNYPGDIAVDGGINELTAPGVVKAGANILATASFFFNSPRPAETVRFLKSLGQEPAR